MEFPYGRAPLAILILAVASGVFLVASRLGEAEYTRPDLVMAIFSKDHADAYRPVIEQFEQERGVNVELQVVDMRALQGRLQSAIQAGSETPDMVELLDGTLGFFTLGSRDDVGFVDITDRVASAGLDEDAIESRFAMWTDRGRTLALPHDVHPVMLAYRADLVEQLGIDVSELTTWDKFAEVGREITRDDDGDGVPDRYMIDLPTNNADLVRMFIAQAGGAMFTSDGQIAFDDEGTIDIVEWYVKAAYGDDRISFPAGWGQTLAKAVSDGLVLFYVSPDWRTKQLENDVPAVSGKMRLMPLPSWAPNGKRTSTWGGTGLAFTKQVEDRGKLDLAWDLAMKLYYDPDELGPRFAATQILPPVKSAFDQPELSNEIAFFQGQSVGRLYADLAPAVPPTPSSPYLRYANDKLLEVVTLAGQQYERRGDEGLRDFIRERLADAAAQVERRMSHNTLYLADLEEAGADE